MKKLISGLSALAIAAAIAPMSAFADTTKVTFDAPRNSPEYIITIPATADLNAETPTATIKAENVYLDTTKHKQINVTLDSADYVSKGDSTFIAKTKDGSSQVTYTIGKGTATEGVKVGDTVASFTNNPDETANPDVQTATLSFSAPTGATYAGVHTEKLTFGISVEDASITFTVKRAGVDSGDYTDGTYTVAPGTTWQQFIASGDAPACLMIYNGNVWHDMDMSIKDCGGTFIANTADNKYVKSSDVIIDGATYGCDDYIGYNGHV
ncbi:MAG: hypothetical protein IJ740_16700 [Ruminococcus sp.]|nr:hypothetical protein [Ruminococcus sp.]